MSNDTPKAKYGGIAFKQKIKTLSDKLNLPTKTYADIWEKQHAKAFVVAGAMQDDLLTDFKRAVLKAVDGTSTLEDFRKDFDQIVAKTGWDYNGGRNWRTRVIYETNTRMAYAAGRYQQMQAVKVSRPYWQYKHSIAVVTPRAQHLAWDGMVLAADDPWWKTHYPPNGYGCDCYVRTLSARDLEGKGLSVSESPAVIWTDKMIGATTNPRVVKVTAGVDAGFAYNVGEAAWGQQLAKTVYDKEIAKLKNQSKWQSMAKTDFVDYGRSIEIPFKVLKPKKVITRSQDPADYLLELIGKSEKVFDVAGSAVLVNAAFLGEHLTADRSKYLPLLLKALEEPYEVWQVFESHKVSKQVSLKRRLFSDYTLDGMAMSVVLTVKQGVLVSWTVVPLKPKRLNKLRKGVLIFSR